MSGFNSKREAAANKLQEPEREALKLAVDGLERILGSFEKDGKVVMKSMIRNELFAEMHLLLKKAKKALAQPAQEQEPVNLLEARRIAAEYGTPDSQVDDGNLYFALSKCLEHIDAQPAQEPVAWVWKDMRGQDIVSLFEPRFNSVPLYTTPPQREWVGLTEEETSGFTSQEMTVVKYVSKVLQEKNA